MSTDSRTRRTRAEDGGSAVEYALLAAGVAALIVAVVYVFGGVVKSTFTKTCGQVSSATTSYLSTC